MGHKTDLRRYAKSIDAVARGRVARNNRHSPLAMRKASAQKLINELGSIDARCKALYAKRDAIQAKLIPAALAAGGRLPLPGDRHLVLVDNFVNPSTGEPRNVAFKTAAIERFKITVA